MITKLCIKYQELLYLISVFKSENMGSSSGLLLLSVVLFSTLHEGLGFFGHGFGNGFGNGFGHGNGHGSGHNQFGNSYTAKWTATGEVPNKLAQAPPAPLYMSFNGRKVSPNDTIPTENMLSRPNLKWKPERGALYTIMLIDFGIERLEGLQYFHWMVTNVPNGFSVAYGDEVRKSIINSSGRLLFF